MKALYSILIISLVSTSLFAKELYDVSQSMKLDAKTEKNLSRQTNITTSPTGEINLDTHASFSSVTLTRIANDGSIETFCTSNAKDARKFMAGDDMESMQGEEK
jgi:hypothetical protein